MINCDYLLVCSPLNLTYFFFCHFFVFLNLVKGSREMSHFKQIGKCIFMTCENFQRTCSLSTLQSGKRFISNLNKHKTHPNQMSNQINSNLRQNKRNFKDIVKVLSLHSPQRDGMSCRHYSSNTSLQENSLLSYLCTRIKMNGPLTVADFMREVLTNPQTVGPTFDYFTLILLD